MDDSNLKYQKIHWYIVLQNSKGSIADTYQFALISEKAKYTYKSETPLIEIQQTGKPIQMYGTLTFINDLDAQTFWNKLTTTTKASDVIYAKLDLTSNSHHWSDDRVEPDIILNQIILGSDSQFAILGIN